MDAGSIIKHIRKKHGMSQEEFAAAIGSSLGSVRKYEQNKIQNLKISVLRKLCTTFHVAPYAFVFPEVWEEHRQFYESDPEVGKFKAIYTVLTDEGRKKVLEYMEDLGQIDRYLRDKTGSADEGSKEFPWKDRKYE